MGSTICFLTISNFLGSQLKALPRIGADAAWLLLFMLISMIFTFYAVVEYIICNYLFRVEQRVDKTRELAIEEKKARIKHQASTANSCRVVSLPPDNETSPNGGSVDFDDINNITVNKDDMLQIGLFKIDRLIVMTNGEMMFKDQHIEISSRYAYPISYVVLCILIKLLYRKEN